MILYLFVVTEFVNKFATIYDSFSHELKSLALSYKQKSSEYARDIEG